MSENEERLSYEDFFCNAIKRLRNTDKSQGIHTVYSGFNEAFREYYGEDPVPVTQKLVDEGAIELRPRKGGVMIYLQGEAPPLPGSQSRSVLDKILSSDSED